MVKGMSEQPNWRCKYPNNECDLVKKLRQRVKELEVENEQLKEKHENLWQAIRPFTSQKQREKILNFITFKKELKK